MGKIVISENISLDGVIQTTDEEGFDRGGWFTRITDEDRAAWADVEFEEAMAATALLMGRRSYDWFLARGWASREGTWADRMRTIPKYVVTSSALTDPEWTGSTSLTGELTTEVSTLGRRIEGDIVVYGSGQLVRALFAQGLVDELRLMTYPIVVGAGERLFGPTGAVTPLQLAETRAVGTGLVRLTYRSVH